MTETSDSHLITAAEAPASSASPAAGAVLASFGVTAAPLREAYVASMGDPYEPHRRGVTLPPATQLFWSAPTWRRSRSPTPRSAASTSCWR